MSQIAEPPVFDIKQLRDICMEDADLMRELAVSLVDDANAKIPALIEAVERADGTGCVRLAHYVKGACANVGAVALAALMKNIERSATAGNFDACRASLLMLNTELQKFSAASSSL
jgi:HPt (histidine-containing phosphotransfer) domain-containing protein